MSLVSDGWTFASGGPPYGGTSYVEYVESGRLSTSWDNSSITRVYQVDDSALGNFLQSLLGYSTYVDEGNFDFQLIRNIPEEDREFPGFFASEVNVERLGQGTLASTGLAPPQDRLSSWNVSRITCQFKPAPFSYTLDGFTGTELDRYITRKYTVVADYLSLQGLMLFVSRPNPPKPDNPTHIPERGINNPPGMQIGWLEKEITHHQVPARQSVGREQYSPFVPPNISTATILLGCTNYTSFDGNAPGTLLFTGYTYKMIMPKLGSLASARQYYYDLTYRFKYQDQGPSTGLAAQPADASGTYHAGVNYIYDTWYKRWDLITSDGTLSGSQIYSNQTAAQYYDSAGHFGNNVDFNALIPNANTTVYW